MPIVITLQCPPKLGDISGNLITRGETVLAYAKREYYFVVPRTNAPTLLGDFAIKIRKGKWVRIWKLHNPEVPRVGGNSVAYIQIDDIHGYYQMAFTEICEPMMKRGLITKREFKTICEGKSKRGQFEAWPMRKIGRYCVPK